MTGTRPMLAAALLALCAAAAPASAQLTTIDICVIENGELTEIEAQYNPQSGDTLVDGSLFSQRYPNTTPPYVGGAQWYLDGEALAIEDTIAYVKYGLPRILGVYELENVGEMEGIPVYVDLMQDPEGYPEVLYVPVRSGCEFQPYRLEVGTAESR